MTNWRWILRSLLHHARTHAAVACGVAAATAVLTGALLVGDSVRGSLQRLTLDRLGRIDEALVSPRFFRAALADELAADAGFQQHFTAAAPTILFPRGTVERQAADSTARATQVLVVGCTPAFWDLGQARYRPVQPLRPGEIVLNAPLASDLGVSTGDEVIVRLPRSNQVPADSPLGRKDDRVRSIAGLKVVEILPPESLGRFDFVAKQSTPRNAYVAIETLQESLGLDGHINAVLVAGRSADEPPGPPARAALEAALRPTLVDLGLAIQRVRRTFPAAPAASEEVVYDYFQLTSDRMLLEPAVERIVTRAWAEYRVQPVFTYLANSIAKADAAESAPSIPYSLVAAVDSIDDLGPVLAADEIVLNRWAADDLQVQPGDRLTLTFYQPETAHGQLAEARADFTVKAIAPLTEPSSPYRRRQPAVFDRRPTVANDPDLTPVVEGVSDQDSIDDWDAPFPVDSRRLRPQDDDYWQRHRTTPKAFISLAAGRGLWGSRFGSLTAVRIPAPGGLTPGSPAERDFVRTLERQVLAEVRRSDDKLGFAFVPVKSRGIAASSGTTPFDMLFLFLSFFVIAAALLLVALLFRLGVERRAAELGTLLALGFRRRHATRLLMAEGLIVAAVGGLLGVACGVGYAWLMLAGLRTWWIGAVATPFLVLYVTRWSLVLGYVSGVGVCAATIAISVRRTRRASVRRLLAGQAADEAATYTTAGRVPGAVGLGLLAVAIALGFAATRLGGEAQAGAFVGSGTLVLAALLIWLRAYLRAGGAVGAWTARLTFSTLAARNAARNPGRSVLTVGLIAVASFLIVAMSAFRLSPTDAGTGGFALLAEAAEPIFADLNTPAGREDLLAGDAAALQGTSVLALRVRSGDDASCNNLYQASQPRVLGVTEPFAAFFDDPAQPGFAWAGSAACGERARANPWRLLNGSDIGATPSPVPVVLDKNTALYSLHLYQGIGEEFELTYDDVGPIRFRVVGLLANSVLQGSLLIGETDFLRLYPDTSGYRFFLVRTPPDAAGRVAETLERRLSDQGFDAVPARERLEELLAVQNTYLSTFQSLGALGLLLGTFGVAAVQVRNVLDRRGELALMRAAGFRRARLASLVMLENVALLAGGLSAGFVSALVAVLPHMLLGGAAVPLGSLAVMLAAVSAAGVVSSLASVRTTLRAPLIAALRGD